LPPSAASRATLKKSLRAEPHRSKRAEEAENELGGANPPQRNREKSRTRDGGQIRQPSRISNWRRRVAGTIKVLEEMGGFDVAATLEHLRKHGGCCCDCEVLMNVDRPKEGLFDPTYRAGRAAWFD
jgi:hypothetical protein